MNRSLLYYSSELDILCVTYFQTSITMPDHKLAICKMMSEFPPASLALTSCEFYDYTFLSSLTPLPLPIEAGPLKPAWGSGGAL